MFCSVLGVCGRLSGCSVMLPGRSAGFWGLRSVLEGSGGFWKVLSGCGALWGVQGGSSGLTQFWTIL
eukprot:261925-Alexandrium_andersonii.AAC.1